MAAKDEPRAPEPGQESAPEAAVRRPRPLEGMYQEIVRRAASVGLSSLFLTEEAVRKALADTLPQDWADYLARQGQEVREDLVDRVMEELRRWLQQLDPQELPRLLARSVLDQYDFTVTIDVKASPRAGAEAPSLKLAPRRK